jgi:hypothetical protein
MSNKTANINSGLKTLVNPPEFQGALQGWDLTSTPLQLHGDAACCSFPENQLLGGLESDESPFTNDEFPRSLTGLIDCRGAMASAQLGACKFRSTVYV